MRYGSSVCGGYINEGGEAKAFVSCISLGCGMLLQCRQHARREDLTAVRLNVGYMG